MPKLSAAASTISGNNSAIRRFDEFQKARSDPAFCELKELHVSEEHLQKLMLDFGTYLVKTDLHYGQESTITPTVKAKYFGKVKEELKQKFPKHSAWRDEAEWYTPLQNGIEKGATRTNLLSDEAFDSKTLPFYPAIRADYVRSKHRELILHGKVDYANDMRSLCYLLMKEATGEPYLQGGPLQQRVWFVMSMLAVGRGGEIKFQRYDEWHWDVLFQSIDSTWTEIKTLTQHCMLFGPDKESYLCDFYHAFGCFFSVEKGLYRANDVDKSVQKFVFPCLHGIVNASVAAKLTKIMRDHVSPETKKHVSSRSIRKGAATFLSMNPAVTEAELNARGGWASETNSKAYKETTPFLTIAGQNALALWNDVRTPKYAPQLKCLGDHVQPKVEEFIGKLYSTVDVPAFGPTGALRPFLRACTASLIMYHFDVVKDFGHHNLVVEKITRAAADAELRDGALTDPIEVLRHWSCRIRENFNSINPDLFDTNHNDIRECLAQTNRLLQQLLTKAEAGRIVAEDQQHSIDHMAQTIASVSKAVQQQGGSPQRRRSPGVVAPSVSNEDDETAIRDAGMIEIASLGKRQFGDVQLAEVPATKRQNQQSESRPKQASLVLKHSSVTEAAGQSSAKTPIEGLLFSLYAHNLFFGTKDRLRSVGLNHLNEQAKYRAAMELVEFVISDEQWEELCKRGRTERETMTTAKAVQMLCLKTLRQWEETVGIKAALANPKRARDKPYYIGIGARVVAYKKEAGINCHLCTAMQTAKKPALKSRVAAQPVPVVKLVAAKPPAKSAATSAAVKSSSSAASSAKSLSSAKLSTAMSSAAAMSLSRVAAQPTPVAKLAAVKPPAKSAATWITKWLSTANPTEATTEEQVKGTSENHDEATRAWL